MNTVFLPVLVLHIGLLICGSTTSRPCTTGYIKNEISNGKMFCCSHVCEDDKSPKYNEADCCSYESCSKHYPRICTVAPVIKNFIKTKTTNVISTSTSKIYEQYFSIVTATASSMERSTAIRITTSDAISISRSVVSEDIPIAAISRFKSNENRPLVPTMANIRNLSKFTTILQEIQSKKSPNHSYWVTLFIAVSAALILSLSLIFGVFYFKRRKQILFEAVNSFSTDRNRQVREERAHSNVIYDINELKLSKKSSCSIGPNVTNSSLDEQLISFLDTPSVPPTPIHRSPPPNERNAFEVVSVDIGPPPVSAPPPPPGFEELLLPKYTVYENEIFHSMEKAKAKFPMEINFDDIIIGCTLGRGYFGKVLKGKLRLSDLMDTIEIAIKAPKMNFCHEEDVNCLWSELKILISIGQHVNVVQLIGAVPKPNRLGPFVLITQFCELGDLENYIRSRKSYHKIFSSEKPTEDELNLILTESVLCYSGLLMYALQIANGLHFISVDKTVIHRDLALRNLLLTNEHVVKISDFGLAVNDSVYEVQTRKTLPSRWLPPESIVMGNKEPIFTVHSDVWSFGIVLWELFTLGDDPAKYKAPEKEHFRQWLLDGNRFCRPEYASDEIADLVTQCWSLKPESRPNFLTCREVIQKSLQDYSDDVYRYTCEIINT